MSGQGLEVMVVFYLGGFFLSVCFATVLIVAIMEKINKKYRADQDKKS